MENPIEKRATGALPSAELAPTGRAKCLHCGEAVAKGSVRIAVEREVDTGAFVKKGVGYLHPGCCPLWAVSGWPAGLAELVAQVRGNSGLAELPPPFREGSPLPVVQAPPPPPGFGALLGEEVAAIVAKLAKLRDDYKGDAVFEKAGLDWSSRDALCWHIAHSGLLEPTHPTLLRRLADGAASASADAVFAVVPKLARPLKNVLELFPGWSQRADLIVLRAMQLDPGRLAALLTDAGPVLRTGIQLVRGRCGEPLSPADRQSVLAALADGESRDGLPRTYEQQGARLAIPTLGADGKLEEPYREALDLAQLFGTAQEWAQALARKARAGKFTSLERVLPGLVVMPLAELVAVLAKPHFSSGEAHDRWVARLIELRDDEPLALAHSALTIGRDQYPGGAVREQLLLHAMARLAARNLQLPEGLEKEPKWDSFQYCLPPWRGSAVLRAVYRQALAAVPRERALALARSMVERDYGQAQALPLLAVHYDEDLARTLVGSEHGIGDPGVLGALGAPVLPLLLAALAEPGSGPTHLKRQAALGQCVRATLGFIGATGGSLDPSLDEWLSCLPEQSYWSDEDRAIFLHMLRAMPEDRRRAALQRLLAGAAPIERSFYGVHLVADSEFRASAARRVVQRYAAVQDSHLLQQGLRALGEHGLSYFRAALLTEKPDTKIFADLRAAFGYAPVEALMKEASIVEEPKLARLLRLAGELAGPKERIYLIERRDYDDQVPPAPAGSFSWSRGRGPGLPPRDAAAPPQEDSEHILTIDLQEVPELQARFPDARGLTLRAPDPEHGDGWDRATLRAVPGSAAAPTDGNQLTVMAVEVPSAIFSQAACNKDPTLQELRGLVFNRPGYLLGEPMFIQGDEGGGGDFVMQLAEQIGGLNLGDSGSLYVFESGSFMQCY